TAATGGGFMALRPGPDADPQAVARPTRLVAGEVADPRRDRVLLEIAGPALAGLDRSDRQRLITTALGFGRTRDLPLRGASPHALMTWVALALPEQRQVEVSRGGPRSTTARQALGVVDVADGSLALLVPAAGLGGGVRLVAHGGRGAERAVLAAVERWHLAGRPGIAEARFTIRYGAVRPHGWYSARRGDQWLALDWVAARRRGPAAAGAGPGPVAAARGDAARGGAVRGGPRARPTLPAHGPRGVPAAHGRHLRPPPPGPGPGGDRGVAGRGAGGAGPGRAQGRPRRPGPRAWRRAGLAGVAGQPARHRPRRGRGPLRRRLPPLRGRPLHLPVTAGRAAGPGPALVRSRGR